MSEQSPQNDNTAVSAAAELGAKLREAREKRGFSIGEVAERLKLPARQIEGLESGNYENMPELVFVRGFLRTYGRFLDLMKMKWPPTSTASCRRHAIMCMPCNEKKNLPA